MMNFQVQQTSTNSGRRIRLCIGILFLAILTFHPYIHPLETIGFYQSYLSCQWIQMAVFILEARALVFFTLLITFVGCPRLYLTAPVYYFFLFSRAPPQQAS